MFEYKFSMLETVALGTVLLLVGRKIKEKIPVLQKYFIPAPVIGGFLFSLITLYGYTSGTFTLTFDGSLTSLFMVVFFTSVGFLASVKVLTSSGISVFIFLVIATVLTIIQNIVGVGLSYTFNINPLYGLAAGSVALTGGHGTSGAFGPVLEEAGAIGATTVAIAAATYGLVAGCTIGGPVGKRLLARHGIVGNSKDDFLNVGHHDKTTSTAINEESITNAVFSLLLALGIGLIFNKILGSFMTLPVYIGPMLAAALIRNIYDSRDKELPMEEISITGNISLSLFLSLSLMTMRLWELAALALPLIVILLVQTVVVALFAYFVTFNIMGRDYDAATMATGHCGFALGATPNAMANMESFTSANGFSPKSFLVIPIVGALFIDFTNALVITFFINLL